MPCNLRVKRKGHSEETFHRRGRGKDESRTGCKNPLFWKLEMAHSGIVMHTFGRSQPAWSKLAGAQYGVTGGCLFFPSVAFGMI